MPKIVSVIPPKGTTITPSQGTKVLLDNGEYLNCINKITLVAEPHEPWKAIIEVYPSNQEQINALLDELTVHKPDLSGVYTAGVENVPKEGTYILRRGEMVITPEQNKTLREQLDKVMSGHGVTEITSFSIGGKPVDIYGKVDIKPIAIPTKQEDQKDE